MLACHPARCAPSAPGPCLCAHVCAAPLGNGDVGRSSLPPAQSQGRPSPARTRRRFNGPAAPNWREGQPNAGSATSPTVPVHVQCPPPELLPLPQGSHAIVLWDAENVVPFQPKHTLPIQMLRLKNFLQRSGAESVELLVAFNPNNMRKAQSTGITVILDALGAQVLQASHFNDAADVTLISAACAMIQGALQSDADVAQHHTSDSTAQQHLQVDTYSSSHGTGAGAGMHTPLLHPSNQPHDTILVRHSLVTGQHAAAAAAAWTGSDSDASGKDERACSQLFDKAGRRHTQLTLRQLVILCMTQDTGFAKLLHYATDQGCFTITAGPFKHGWRRASAAVLPPAVHVMRHQLSIASRAAFRWIPDHAPVTDEERYLISAVEHLVVSDARQPVAVGTGQGISTLRPSAAGLEHTAPGVIKDVWINPAYVR